MQRLNRPEEAPLSRLAESLGTQEVLGTWIRNLPPKKSKSSKDKEDREGEGRKLSRASSTRAEEGIRALVPRINKAG